MNIGSALSGFRLRGFNHNVQSFFMYGVLINAGMALFSLLFNLYLLRLSYQEDFIGLVASMAPLATGLLALPVGMLSDRFGRKPFLVASGLLLAISQLGACLMTSPTALLAFSFIGGIATSFIWVNHVPFLSDNAHSSRRAEALVIWSALQVAIRMLLSLAGGFMPGVMAYFIGASTEMPEPFRYSLLLGALCSIVSIFPLLRIPGHQSGHQRATSTANDHAAPDAAEPIPWRVFTGIATLSGTRGFSMGLTYPFINVFFEEELHVGPAMIGTIFFFSQLVGLPATFSAPALVRRFGATLTILPTRIIGGCALALMGTFINLPVAISMFLLSRMAEVIDNPSDQHFSTQILPRRYWARIQGFRVCGFQILNFAGSLLGGVLILDYGYWAAFGLACVSRVASGFIMAAFFGFRPVEQSDAPD
ncbi:MAG: MFS transporter [Candidatus Latescibacteria bacterium]|jgi:MFS family permease|nr:MFS transporter [Candidatus Latescibacterota bacterium]